MSKQREAMQFALETLEDIFGKHKIDVTAINMLRNALAEPEQEPVAVVASQTGDPVTMSWHHEPALPMGTKLYTTPPARKPLTDEEIFEFADASLYEGGKNFGILQFARAIEKKIRGE